MRLNEILVPEAVTIDLNATTSEEAISELSVLLCDAVDCHDRETMVKLLLEREELGSTAVGHGVAIPHARILNLDGFHAAVGISEKGVDFHASNHDKSHIVFMLVGPMEGSSLYLKALARIARLARDDSLRARLLRCKSSEEAVTAIHDAEAKYLG